MQSWKTDVKAIVADHVLRGCIGENHRPGAGDWRSLLRIDVF